MNIFQKFYLFNDYAIDMFKKCLIVLITFTNYKTIQFKLN